MHSVGVGTIRRTQCDGKAAFSLASLSTFLDALLKCSHTRWPNSSRYSNHRSELWFPCLTIKDGRHGGRGNTSADCERIDSLGVLLERSTQVIHGWVLIGEIVALDDVKRTISHVLAPLQK